MSGLISRPIFRATVLLLIASLVLMGCAAAAQPAREQLAEAPMSAAAPAPVAEEYSAVVNDQAQIQAQSSERIVIKNGSITITVPDPSASMATITAMAEEMGGFVVNANLYKEFIRTGVEAPRASVTIRVPAERMDEAMKRIRAESSEEPVSENISSQDVTSEYVDLQSRLRNLLAAEAELTKIMQEANRTEDVLAVYQQLVQIREQIEVIQGQIKYYDQAAALSAITIELIADAAVQPIEIAGWQPKGVAKEAVEALARTLQFIANAAIWVAIYLLPTLAVLFILFVLPVILLFRFFIRRRVKRAAPTPPAEKVQ